MEKINNREQPLVSIIVITYNSSKYVIETLESAKNQTYQNIELIISDDASKDETVKICSQWLIQNKERFVKTELITVSENTGVPANCNRGLMVANGKWIKLIAGDDILLRNCIKENLLFIGQNSCYMVYSNMLFFNNEREWEERNYLLEYFNLIDSKRKLRLYARHSFFMNVPSWFIKRNIISEIGGFDEEFKLLEDQPFLLKFLNLNYKVKFLNVFTIKYRVNEGSIVQTQSLLFIDYLELCFKKIRVKKFKKFNPKDFIYKYDQLLRYKMSRSPNSIGLKILHRVSPAKYFITFLIKFSNKKFPFWIKRLIS